MNAIVQQIKSSAMVTGPVPASIKKYVDATVENGA